MPLTAQENVQSGQRGVARTVIVGHEIIEIPLTVLGTLQDQLGPGIDLTLVQLEGPIADEIGVASGMSGSPVYIDGKLLGALSYRMGNMPKSAIGGVTPIAAMLDAHRLGHAPVGSSSGLDAATVRPIGTPVHIAGLHGTLRDWAATTFDEFGMQLLPGAGGTAAGNDEAVRPLEPGSPLGVALVRGDMNIAASGTVTAIDGERVWAFGHPFLGSGRVEMPMLQADVIHTLADLSGSTKLTRTGPVIGAIVEDRLTAVVGDRGRRAAMIPMVVAITDPAGSTEQLRVEVVRHDALTPLLLAVVSANALSNRLGFEAEATIHARATIHLQGHEPLVLESMRAGGGGSATLGLANDLQASLGLLWGNPYEPLEIESLDVAIQVTAARREYRLVDLQYDRGPLRPGSTLVVRCVIESYRGPRRIETLELSLPRGLDVGRLGLAVGSPADVARALGRRDLRRIVSAVDLNPLIQVASEGRGAHRLTAVLYRFADGVAHRGLSLSQLPPTARRLIGNGTAVRRNVVDRIVEYDRIERELDGPLSGGLVVGLQLDPNLEAENAP